MKWLKYSILGVLIAEIIYICTSNPKAKNNITKAQGLEKAKILGEELISLNRHIREHLTHNDYQQKINHILHNLQDIVQIITTSTAKAKTDTSRQKQPKRTKKYRVTSDQK